MASSNSIKDEGDSFATDQLKRQIQNYVLKSEDFVHSSYGEIEFLEKGRKPSYSPFVTVKKHADPLLLWELLTQHWDIPVPCAIISTVAKFKSHNATWRAITKKSWIFTNGYSPTSAYEENTCVVAILSEKHLPKCLAKHTRDGLFPLSCRGTEMDTENQLDCRHSHFIFVNGSDAETFEFHRKLLSSFTRISPKHAKFTDNYIEIPVVVAIHNREYCEFLHAAKCLSQNHKVIFSEKLSMTVGSQIPITNNKEAEANRLEDQATILSWYKNETDRNTVETFFAALQQQRNIVLYSPSNISSMRKAIIQSMINGGIYQQHSIIRLIILWKCSNMFKDYAKENVFLADVSTYRHYIYEALAWKCSQFMQIFYDDECSEIKSITVGMLYHLYKQELSTRNNFSEAFHSFMKNKDVCGKMLLKNVGAFISASTDQACQNIYDGPFYKFDDAEKWKHAQYNENMIDLCNSPLLPFPERDIFIWCILTSRNEIAEIVWKNGSNFIASALLASTLYKGVSKHLMKSSQTSRNTLKQYSEEWETRAEHILQYSSDESEICAQSLVMENILELGNCSCLTLAYGGKLKSFMTTSTIQKVFDLVWRGYLKFGTHWCKILLLFLCPFLIPLFNVTKEKESFSAFSDQVYKPKFSRKDEGTNSNSDSQLDSSVMDDESLRWKKQSSCKTFAANVIKDIHRFYKTPRVRFISSAFFLLVTILIMSVALVTMNIYRYRLTLLLHLCWISWYMAGCALKLLRKVIIKLRRTSSGQKNISLITSLMWKDVVTITTYFAGLAIFILTSSTQLWYFGKFLFCLTLFLMYVHIYSIFTLSQQLGQLIQTIKGMVKDLVGFLAIQAVIFFPYALISHNLQQENMPQSNSMPEQNEFGSSFQSMLLGVYNGLFRVPYWQFSGNLLDSVTEEQKSIPMFIQTIFTAVYVLFSTLFFVNLLIAMFSYTFENIQEKSYEIWGFNRYEIIEDFAGGLSLPSPLVIISLVRELFTYATKTRKKTFIFKKRKCASRLSREFENEIIQQFYSEEPSSEGV